MDCSKVARFLPDKLRRKVFHLGGLQEDLNNVIWEEKDVLAAQQRLIRERREALQFLGVWASNEDGDLRQAIEGMRENQEKVADVQQEYVQADQVYIDTLSEILMQSKDIDSLEKQERKHKAAVRKGETAVQKKQRALTNPGNKPDFNRAKAAEELAQAEQKLKDARGAVDQTAQLLEQRKLEVKNFKNQKIRTALVSFVEASILMHERSAAIMRQQLALAKSIRVDLAELPSADLQLHAVPHSAALAAVSWVLREKCVPFVVQPVDPDDDAAVAVGIRAVYKGDSLPSGVEQTLKYVESTFASFSPSFALPADLAEEKAVNAWALASRLRDALRAVEMEGREVERESLTPALTSAICELDKMLEQEPGEPFLFSSRPCLVDAALAGSLVRLPALQQVRGFKLPEGLQRVPAFLAAVRGRDGFPRDVSEEETVVRMLKTCKLRRPLSLLPLSLQALHNAIAGLQRDIACLEPSTDSSAIGDPGRIDAQWSDIKRLAVLCVAIRDQIVLPALQDKQGEQDAAVQALRAAPDMSTSGVDDAITMLTSEDELTGVTLDAVAEALGLFSKSVADALRVHAVSVAPVLRSAFTNDENLALLRDALALSEVDVNSIVSFTCSWLDQAQRRQMLVNLRAASKPEEWDAIQANAKAALSEDAWRQLVAAGFGDIETPTAAAASVAPIVSNDAGKTTADDGAGLPTETVPMVAGA